MDSTTELSNFSQYITQTILNIRNGTLVSKDGKTEEEANQLLTNFMSDMLENPNGDSTYTKNKFDEVISALYEYKK